MVALSYLYRSAANFVFLAATYFGLSILEKYEQRAILAVLILVYALMRTISVLRSFSFYSRIERLESDMRRLMGGVSSLDSAARRKLVGEISSSRIHGERKAYIDLLFLCLVALLCLARISLS